MRFVGLVCLSLVVGAGVLTGPGPAVEAAPSPQGTVYVVGKPAQGAADAFWTPMAMAAAAPDSSQRQTVMLGPVYQPQPGPLAALLPRAPLRGTPNSVSFGGVPTVGALFYTKGRSRHFCTASVVNSSSGDLVLTAAHCVYTSGYSANIEFVPGYRGGVAPYGAWPVAKIIVAKGWRQRQDPSLDYAFLEVNPPSLSAGSIQDVTGALNLGFRLHDAQHIVVIGYNDSNQTPIRCATRSFKISNSQMEFYCRGFWLGTSGGPWIINYNGGTGSGTVFGVIGGYENGGYTSWASYSTIFWQGAESLFRQAEAAAA